MNSAMMANARINPMVNPSLLVWSGVLVAGTVITADGEVISHAVGGLQ